MIEGDLILLITSYQGYVQAALVLGGVDVTGPHLHTVRDLTYMHLKVFRSIAYYSTNL